MSEPHDKKPNEKMDIQGDVKEVVGVKSAPAINKRKRASSDPIEQFKVPHVKFTKKGKFDRHFELPLPAAMPLSSPSAVTKSISMPSFESLSLDEPSTSTGIRHGQSMSVISKKFILAKPADTSDDSD